MSTTYEFVVIAKSEDGTYEEVKSFFEADEAILFRDRIVQERGLAPNDVFMYGRMYGPKAHGGGS